MSIIPPFPFALVNGTVADASQVMADLNQIRDNVNVNAAGGGGAGNVVGPASAVDGHLAVFDGTTGKILKDGGAVPGGGSTYRGAVAAFSVDQLVTIGDTILAFNVTNFDTDSVHDNAVNNSRMTVPAGVTKVKFFFSISFYNTDTATSYSARLRKNSGGDINIFTVVSEPNGYGPTNALSSAMATIACTAGDYFEVIFNNVDRSGTMARATDTFFEMQILG